MTETQRPVRVPKLPEGVQLVGLRSGDLQTLLGQPTLIRSEQQAQYWRYNLGGCQLDLFLYKDAQSDTAKVAYLDVRPSGYSAPAQAEVCTEVARRLTDETSAKAEPSRDPTGGSLPPVEEH